MAGSPPICLFDGVCVLCSSGVQYTLRHERDHEMRFVAIQSREGRALALRHGVDPDQPDSFLFIENDVVMRKSDAVLGVVNHLRWPARLVLAARVLPRPLRDWLYDRLARNRYRLFGRMQSCGLPDPGQRHRFSLPEPV